MNKKIKLSIIFRYLGLFFFVLVVVFIFLSFNVKREIQEVFGFSSIAFIPVGVCCLFVGQLFQKDRSKHAVIGMAFLATGVTLLLLGMVLMFGILITIFGFGTKAIWIYIDGVFLFFGLTFTSIGSVLKIGAKSKPH